MPGEVRTEINRGSRATVRTEGDAFSRRTASQTVEAIFSAKNRRGAANLPRKSKTLIFIRASIIAGNIAVFYSCHAEAAPLSLEIFDSLVNRCASSVPAQTLRAVAITESDLNPLALYDNTTGQKEEAESRAQALSDATRWVQRGDSVDIGLMQINSANLPALKMTVASALDPCTSMAAGTEVLRAAYGGGRTPADRQAALLMALSRYNTGSPLRGIMNGYVRKVLANAGSNNLPLLPVDSSKILSDEDMPPSWNVSATGVYALTHGAPWLVALAPASFNQTSSPYPPSSR